MKRAYGAGHGAGSSECEVRSVEKKGLNCKKHCHSEIKESGKREAERARKRESMTKFKPIPESVFLRRIAIALGLLVTIILIGAIILYPGIGNFKEAFTKSAEKVTRVTIAGENAFIFFIFALFGYVLAFYAVYVSIEFALEGKIKHLFLETKMEKKIGHLKNHCIVCGYGRVGRSVVAKLTESGKDVVIMEKDERLVQQLQSAGYLAMVGTLEEEDLERAGIKNARFLVTCTGDDGRNLLLIMAGKELNPNVTIASRASDVKIIKKMKYAGATHVIMPEVLGGEEIVDSILKTDRLLERQKGGLYRSS
ncbi:MAG TPA: hypothetical protein HA282_02430 [Nanoarchaeota archaeon]|nr:hypothetical protein [Nanoarchaeota archaeon]